MSHRVASQATSDLDDIWHYVAKESGSSEVANRLVHSITDRFLLLSRHPYLGRSREDDFGIGRRSFAVGEYVIVYRVENKNDVLILRVAHGRRDIDAWFEN